MCFFPSLFIDRTDLSELSQGAARVPATFDLFSDALQVLFSLLSVSFSSAVITG